MGHAQKGLAINGGAPVREDFLVFGRPLIGQEEIDEVVDSLQSGWIGTGPKVGRFEKLVEDYVGGGHARAVSSCTAGMHLALIAAGVAPGDEVITTPFTFAATVNVILHVGATPVLVDIERDTLNIDIQQIAEAMTDRTRAIMPVHMYGRPCDVFEVNALAEEASIPVIEDAAHALGAQVDGHRIGSISEFTVFSFYATKNVTTGEGGMVLCRDREKATEIEMLALHGLSAGAWTRYSSAEVRDYRIVAPGYKYNMTDIEAAIGMHQISRIESWQKRREEIWGNYDDAFRDTPLLIPSKVSDHHVHARHLYTLYIDSKEVGFDRDWFRQALHREGIGTGVHFIPLHKHPYYQEKLSNDVNRFPNSERAGRGTVSLPLGPGLSDDDVESVIVAVRKILALYGS